MNQQFDIVIVGAGVTGLTIAAMLAQSRHRDRLNLTIVDSAARPCHRVNDDISLRVSAIATGSAELLDSIGAWTYVAATRVGPYDRMRVWDEAGSAESGMTLRFDAAEFAVAQLGFIVENDLLRHSLLRELDHADIEFCFGSPIRSLQRQGRRIRLNLKDAHELDADLVIGADGARSFVRQSVGIETSNWPYHQTAVVTHMRPEQPHRNTAWQRFLRDGPLGILPLSDGRISVVWTTTQEKADRALSANDDELGRLLSDASDHVLGELSVAGPRGAFPLCAHHALQYVLPGIALIGDAAHVVHPLAGQGANLGLRDAKALATVIDDAFAAGEHPGDRPVLRRYERARKGPNATMLHFMTGLNRVFATDSELLNELRMVGMRLFNDSGPIRKHAVKVALGVGGVPL